jgi:S-adenosylmethionine-diacylglycerol 3-amino-3-carboxypropyl transferase
MHRPSTVRSLLEPRAPAERRRFYDEEWDTAAWRLLFRLFFSQPVLGRLGRDPSFFRYADGSVADHLRARVRHALVDLDASENPYVGWILTGQHPRALPHALRAENFEAIRAHLDRLEWHCVPVEELTADRVGASIDRANLSDVLEYLSPDHTRALLGRVADLARPGARLAYWNMMVPRRGGDCLPRRLRALPELAARLFAEDKAFFYRAFVVEEVVC